MAEIRKPLVIVEMEVHHNLMTQGGSTALKRLDNVKSCTVPGISFKGVNVGGAGYMGDLEVPVPGSFGSMVFELATSGVDVDSGDLLMPRTHRFMIATVQAVHSTSKWTHPQGLKWFLTGDLKSADGGTVEKSSAVERKYSYELFRFEEYVNGEESLLVDKVNGIYKVKGKDMWEEWRKYLEV